jgi:hypothetical protein
VQKNVKFVHQEVKAFGTFVEENEFDIIFNCIGIGANKLFNDEKVIPIRGQMIHVRKMISYLYSAFKLVSVFGFTKKNIYLNFSLKFPCESLAI